MTVVVTATRGPGIGARLVVLNVALLALAATSIALVSESLLSRQGQEQALARVALGARSAREALDGARRDVAAHARVLSERPTLRRILEEGDASALAAFLERFQESAGLSGCAVLQEGRIAGQSEPPLPWSLEPAGGGDAGDGSVERDAAGALVLVGRIPVHDVGGASVLTARVMDDGLLHELSSQVGLDVAVVPRNRILGEYGDAHATEAARVLTDGAPSALRSEALAAYCGLEAVRIGSGELAAVIEARLPTAGVDHELARLRRTLVLLTLLAGMLAMGASVVAARAITLPVSELERSAERLGRGDLTSPVPAGGPAEIGALGRVMEDMRSRLLTLTMTVRQREAEGAAVLAGISEGVLTVDRDRRIRYVNPQAAAMLGMAPDAALGRFCGDALHPGVPADARPCDESCPIVAARSMGTSILVERLAGSAPVLVAAAPPAEHRQMVMLRQETEAEAGRRMRDAILANVSHEFRTPLSAQLASIELLRERLQEGRPDEAAVLVESLERGTLRLARLVDNLLESVRIEAGEGSMRERDVQLDEVVEEAVAQTAPLLHQRRQQLDVELPFPVPVVRGDATRLVQVFVNLLANANKYAPEGAAIRIGGEVATDSVSVWIEDDGPGLPAGSPDALFRPFVRSAGDEPEQSGVGLGLWVVRSIVARHGGEVEARDTDRGARFTVRLPRRTSPEGPTIGA